MRDFDFLKIRDPFPSMEEGYIYDIPWSWVGDKKEWFHLLLVKDAGVGLDSTCNLGEGGYVPSLDLFSVCRIPHSLNQEENVVRLRRLGPGPGPAERLVMHFWRLIANARHFPNIDVTNLVCILLDYYLQGSIKLSWSRIPQARGLEKCKVINSSLCGSSIKKGVPIEQDDTHIEMNEILTKEVVCEEVVQEERNLRKMANQPAVPLPFEICHHVLSGLLCNLVLRSFINVIFYAFG